jgi:hypothetical protein
MRPPDVLSREWPGRRSSTTHRMTPAATPNASSPAARRHARQWCQLWTRPSVVLHFLVDIITFHSSTFHRKLRSPAMPKSRTFLGNAMGMRFTPASTSFLSSLVEIAPHLVVLAKEHERLRGSEACSHAPRALSKHVEAGERSRLANGVIPNVGPARHAALRPHAQLHPRTPRWSRARRPHH